MEINKLNEFIDYDINNNYIIEPDYRMGMVKERLFDIINSYNPRVIVKAGIGNGAILIEIASNFKSYIVVVDPSLKAINDFIKKNRDFDKLDNIKFINGNFHNFPVDYYSADLLICVDYLDFVDSSQSINEFRRATQFEGIFFYAGVVLNADDIEGIYDDFMRMIFPLHNDYYLPEDLKTFLELKEFRHVKSVLLEFESNLQFRIDYFRKIFGERPGAIDYINEHREEFIKILKMKDNYTFMEPYYIGAFMRKKPE